MLKRRGFTGLLLTAAGGWSGLAEGASTPRTLFTIARSTNANIVRYVARIDGGGLELATPVDAYWLMLAENGRREPLSWTERELAYGFATSGTTADGCTLNLVAFKERPIQVERSSSGFRAIVTISGRRAVLKRIFVRVQERALLPSVQSLDVFGTSLDGVPVRERIARH